LLAEIGQQLGTAALNCLAERQHRVEMDGQTAAVDVVAVRSVDQLALLHHVSQPVRQPGGGGQAVPTGPAGLLVIALDGLRQVEVGDETHVGLVDAHAERDRGDHDQAVLPQETSLIRGSGVPVEPGVVRQCVDPIAHQELGDFLHRRAGEAVDDSRVAGVLGA
jgi:hypothetical protein